MCNTANDMWEKLHGIFEQRTEQKQDRLFNLLFGIKETDPVDSIATHVAKLEKLWIDLNGETRTEDSVRLSNSLFVN